MIVFYNFKTLQSAFQFVQFVRDPAEWYSKILKLACNIASEEIVNSNYSGNYHAAKVS